MLSQLHQTDSLRLRAGLLARMRQNRETCSIFTEAAVQAFSLLGAGECSMSTLAGVLQWDPRLAAKVLAFANSAFYAPPHPIARLDDAIVLIGLEELRSVIVSASASEYISTLTFTEERIRNRLCHHGCFTAIVCRRLTEGLKLPFRGEEFSAGLLHDIGRFLMAAFEPDAYARWDAERLDTTSEVIQHEREIFGIDHCELGGLFAELHRLPRSLATCMAFHHRVDESPVDLPLVALVAGANHLVHQDQAATASQPYEPLHDLELLKLLQRAVPAATARNLEWLPGLLATARRQATTMTILFSNRT
jgi:HD-like signal output (HDOD) protein